MLEESGAEDFEGGGFKWIDFHDAEKSVVSYLRYGKSTAEQQASATDAQVAQVQSQVKALESDYNARKGEVDGLQEEIDYYENLPKVHVVEKGEFLQKISGYERIYADAAKWPRIYFAMARDGLAPAPLARLSAGGHVPVMAIVAQGGLAAILALTGAFEALLIYIGSSLLLFNALTIATLFVVRRRNPAPAPFMTPLFPGPALVFLAITVAAWGSGLAATPGPTLAALATLAGGAGVYFAGQRFGWFRSPGTADAESSR